MKCETPTILAERTLLILCAQVEIDRETDEKIREICIDSINWPILLELAESNDLTALLYLHLNRIRPEGMPPNILQFLSVRFIELARRSMLMVEHLVPLLAVFRKEGVQCIPFGAPFFAERFFDDLVLLPFPTIDLFVSEPDFSKAHEILTAHGYRPLEVRPTVPLNKRLLQSQAFLKVCDQYMFVKEPEQIFVSLSWRIFPPALFASHLDTSKFRREDWMLAGHKIESLSTATSILVLCSQASSRVWCKIGWITTVAEIVKNSGINLLEVHSEAKSLGVERPFLLGLYLATHLTATTLPELPALLQEKVLKNRHIARIAQAIIRYHRGQENDKKNLQLGGMAYQLDLREAWSDRLASFLSLVSRPSLDDCMRNPLPNRLFFLYYFLHPVNRGVDWCKIQLVKLFIDWQNESKLIAEGAKGAEELARSESAARDDDRNK